MTTRAAGRTRQAATDVPPSTREQILDAAERLFSARGLDGVAVRDLARETGLTASSLYNHFPSKQALYDAVLERGVRPIMEVIADAWNPTAFRLEHIRATLDKLIAHLAAHPHLARLLQRALLEEPTTVEALVARWLAPVYREAARAIERAAGQAGWKLEDVPHLTIGLFGMIFAYFANVSTLQGLTGWTADPLSPRALAEQRRFLEQAIFRLVGPRPRVALSRRKPRA